MTISGKCYEFRNKLIKRFDKVLKRFKKVLKTNKKYLLSEYSGLVCITIGVCYGLPKSRQNSSRSIGSSGVF